MWKKLLQMIWKKAYVSPIPPRPVYYVQQKLPLE